MNIEYDVYVSPQVNSITHHTRLLIVDDEPHIRSSLVRALSFQGYKVDEAGSGKEALALLKKVAPDLILLDMNLPDLGGLEVMCRAREMYPDLAIVVLTGYATLDNAIAAIKVSATDYLCKPASHQEIAAAVSTALKKQAKKQQQQQLSQMLSATMEALEQIKHSNGGSTAPARRNLIANTDNIIRVPPLLLDRQRRLVVVGDNPSWPIYLTKGETMVLATLMSQPGQIFSCQELAEAAWGYSINTDEAKSVIRPCMSRLRNKLKVAPHFPDLIHTVRRRGYYFSPNQY
jgi:DNA-binding response OmpR family regulator